MLDRVIVALTVLFSKEGVVWIAIASLVAAAFCGWIDGPLEGPIRAYSIALFRRLPSAGGSVAPARLLSFGGLCLAAASLTAWARIRRRPLRLEIHVGAALLLVALCFPVGLVSRSAALVESLAHQDDEREAIRSFASTLGAYSATLPASDLAGTSTLARRLTTAVQATGVGWRLVLFGAGVLLIVGLAEAEDAAARKLLGWSVLGFLALATIGGPAAMAEYHRSRGEALYAAGAYAKALGRFERSLRWVADLRENTAFQYRVGAARYWMGDEASAEARFFLSQNQIQHHDFEQAELQLRLAAAAQPRWELARRELAEVKANRGLRLFEQRRSGAIALWEQAIEVDPGLMRIPYYLARAYYEVDDVDQSRTEAQIARLIRVVADRGILADLYAQLGDAQVKAHRYVEAREMYRRSIAMVPLVRNKNLRAQKGLLGL